MAKENLILTESQVQALERKKQDDIAADEIETAHPGYLGSQDTFYVGTLKGVGRIYQQTFIDTYAKVGFAKLYTTKTPITAADLLNDKVLPFYEKQQLPLSKNPWMSISITQSYHQHRLRTTPTASSADLPAI